ncbi:MAG: beta strand repeat-containing protein [Candidatus Hodarchaeales archaeon]|jgi:hypothetical protein
MSDGIILRQGINSLSDKNDIGGKLNVSGNTVVGGFISGDGSGVTNIPISGITNLQTELDSKTNNTDFTSHTGDTTIHYTKSSINLSDLGSSAHTHPISEVINLQTELDSKTDNTNFNSHTGDTTIHYTKSSINLSDLGSSAHTHSISEVINLQTELDGKVETSLFNTYTGDTETALNGKTDNTNFNSHTGDTTIHYTKSSINLSDLGSSAHTHTLSEITDFNSYSGSVQTQIDGKVETTLFNTYTGNTQTTLNTKIETASNVGGGSGLFSGKSGTDLQFKTLTSTGATVTITDEGDTINLESAGGSSLWSENSGDGIYFSTAGDVVAIGDTATNGLSEGGKLYIKGDSAITNALKIDREDDATALTVDSTTGVVDMDYGATIGTSDMFDVGVTVSTWIKYNPTSSMKMEWQQGGVLKARILTQSGYGSFQVYDNAGVSYYKLDGVNNNYENTAQDFTFGTTTSLGARVGIRGTGTGSGTSSLITQDSGGNTTFEVKDDGTVVIPTVGSATSVTNLGVDASGNVVSGTTGGGSLWTDNTNRLTNDTYAITELNNSTSNTYNGSYLVGNLTVGNGNTYTNGSARTVIVGLNNNISTISQADTLIAVGNGNTIRGGLYNLIVGANHILEGDKNTNSGDNNDIYGDENVILGADNVIGQVATPVNNSIAIGNSNTIHGSNQIVFGSSNNLTFNNTETIPGIFFGLGYGSMPNAGFWTDPAYSAGAQPMNFSFGTQNAAREGSTIISGSGAGILYLNNTTSQVIEPTANVADSVALWVKDRTASKAGLIIKPEDGTKHFFGDFSAIGGDETVATANKTLTIRGTGTGSGTSSLVTEDSGGNTTFEVRDDGVSIFKSFTVTEVGSLSAVAGGFIYVSDETGGATMAFSDGTNWRRVQDRAIVS